MDLHDIEQKGCARGSIEVVCGSMFSGKTEELMRRIKRAKIAKLNVEVFKPAVDIRYDEEMVVSHDANAIESMPVESADSILLYSSSADVVGIDEAQFFNKRLIDVVRIMADQGIRVIIAGLDMDFMRQPFGCMPELMAIADSVLKVHAICMDCGMPANYSFRMSEDDKQIVLGELDKYRPLCRSCYLNRVEETKK